MTYEIPVDGYEGRVQLQTLARRIARAVVHFLQVSACPERAVHLPSYTQPYSRAVLTRVLRRRT